MDFSGEIVKRDLQSELVTRVSGYAVIELLHDFIDGKRITPGKRLPRRGTQCLDSRFESRVFLRHNRRCADTCQPAIGRDSHIERLHRVRAVTRGLPTDFTSQLMGDEGDLRDLHGP
ncbi:MAG TPA: hypothetical protein VI585_05480 [Candidatus Binatia bacterium]